MTLEEQVQQNNTELKNVQIDILHLQEQNKQLLAVINEIVDSIEMLVNKLKER